jgi:hypothetical protein
VERSGCTRLSDEEIAIAAILERTGLWCRDEAEAAYPVAAACHDHLLSLAINESAATGGPLHVSPL